MSISAMNQVFFEAFNTSDCALNLGTWSLQQQNKKADQGKLIDSLDFPPSAKRHYTQHTQHNKQLPDGSTYIMGKSRNTSSADVKKQRRTGRQKSSTTEQNEFYLSRSIKPRTRRTAAEIEQISSQMIEVAREIKPCTIRQLFYQMVSRGYIEKTEKPTATR